MGIIATTVKNGSLALGFYREAVALERLVRPARRAEHKEAVEFFRRLLPAQSLCFDVGANIGERTEAMLAAGASVVAFEPQDECVRALQMRCTPYRRRLRVCDEVLGASPGEVTLHRRARSTQSSLRADWEGEPAGQTRVDMTTLDGAIARFGLPYYVKIDVEGYELEVLKGLSRPLQMVSFEYHASPKEFELASACMREVEQLGPAKFNVISSASMKFAFEQWLSADEVLDRVPSLAEKHRAFRYGDIFASTSVSPS